jgi:hypothetical protein
MIPVGGGVFRSTCSHWKNLDNCMTAVLPAFSVEARTVVSGGFREGLYGNQLTDEKVVSPRGCLYIIRLFSVRMRKATVSVHPLPFRM